MRSLATIPFASLLAVGCTVQTQPARPMPSGPPGYAEPPVSTAPPPPAPSAPAPAIPPTPPPPAPPPPPVPPPPSDRAEERQDDRSDRQFDRRSNWDKLGERRVDSRRDRDVIKVGKRDGKFVAIAVVVEHSALELFDLVVTFGDGSTFSPPTRLVFAENSRSRVIDLPGDARFIKKVEFRYGNLAGGGKAEVELWGLDARRDAGDGRDGGRKHRGRGGR